MKEKASANSLCFRNNDYKFIRMRLKASFQVLLPGEDGKYDSHFSLLPPNQKPLYGVAYFPL